MDRDYIEVHDDNGASEGKFTRDQSRWMRLNHATGTLKQHFVDGGDSQAQAKSKVRQLSTEVSEMGGEPIMNYILGNKQPLKNKINNSALSFMDTAAKLVIVNKL